MKIIKIYLNRDQFKIKDTEYMMQNEFSVTLQNRKKQDCKKFLICGGCDFRHINELWLQNYKLMDLNDFNKKLKIKFQVLPIFQSNNYSRQRASFACEIKNGVFNIGFISIFKNQIQSYPH